MNKSWKQHPTKQQLYGHLPPISKTIQIRRTRHVGHCRRSMNELISDVFLWTPSYERASVGRPARTYLQQLFMDKGCRREDLPKAMDDRDDWRGSFWEIRAWSTAWWWWWWSESKLLEDLVSICGTSWSSVEKSWTAILSVTQVFFPKTAAVYTSWNFSLVSLIKKLFQG